jgi:uncharacterized protein YbjT (DUF2867 family)
VAGSRPQNDLMKADTRYAIHRFELGAQGVAGQGANVNQQEPPMESPSKTLRLMLVGSTGAVGQEVLRLALADARISRIIAPTRRPLPTHPKLENPVVDFSALPDDAPWWSVDAVICTLGTTLKVAGSQHAFAAIDRDLPRQVARLAQKAGAARFALNSSLGARLSGNFYLRTKAEAEQGIRDLGYQRFTIVRPSLIDAKRTPPRLAERAGLLVETLLRPLIPRRYRAVAAESIARALIEGVMRADTGEQIIESENLQQ